MDLGQSLKYFRKKSNLKQKEVCSSIGVVISHLSQVEKNRKEPSLSLLKKLSGLYNVPLPIIWLYALEEKDIPEKSKYHFKLLNSLVDILVSDCFGLKIGDFKDMACYSHPEYGNVYYKKRKDNIL